jgi:hypothetical protein
VNVLFPKRKRVGGGYISHFCYFNLYIICYYFIILLLLLPLWYTYLFIYFFVCLSGSGTVFVTPNPDTSAVFPQNLVALKQIRLSEETDYVSLINEVHLHHVCSHIPNVVQFFEAFCMDSDLGERDLWVCFFFFFW